MSPSAVSQLSPIHAAPVQTTESAPESYLLDRDLNTALPYVVGSNGSYILLEDGREIFDACGGAAVTCIGHGNTEVREAINKQGDQAAYVHSMFFKTYSTESLAEELITSTGKKLAKVFIICSGMFLKIYYLDV